MNIQGAKEFSFGKSYGIFDVFLATEIETIIHCMNHNGGHDPLFHHSSLVGLLLCFALEKHGSCIGLAIEIDLQYHGPSPAWNPFFSNCDRFYLDLTISMIWTVRDYHYACVSCHDFRQDLQVAFLSYAPHDHYGNKLSMADGFAQ